MSAVAGGNLLNVQPPELIFPLKLKKQSSCSLTLANNTDQHVAFKVKTTHPKKYTVRPNHGLLLPGSTCNVTVTMQAPKELPMGLQCKDKFLIQSVVVPDGIADEDDITAEMFDKRAGNVVGELKLRVVYILRDKHPLPVLHQGSSSRETIVDDKLPLPVLQQGSSSSRETIVDDKLPLPVLQQGSSSSRETIVENQKLSQELDGNLQDGSRREMGRNHGGDGDGSFSMMFLVFISLMGILVGYLMKKEVP